MRTIYLTKHLSPDAAEGAGTGSEFDLSGALGVLQDRGYLAVSGASTQGGESEQNEGKAESDGDKKTEGQEGNEGSEGQSESNEGEGQEGAAGEGGEEGQEGQEGEGDGEGKGEAAEDKAPEFTPEQTEFLKKQQAEKESALAEAKQTIETLTQQTAELKEKLEAKGGAPVTPIAPMHPLFLVNSPADLDLQAKRLDEFEQWALNNWDGVEAVEASADGKTPARAGYTAQQIRSAYASIKKEREQVLPAARQLLQEHQAANKEAQALYPELFKKGTPEHTQAQQILHLAPGLRVLMPNIMTIIGDAMRGEKVRLAEQKAQADKTKKLAGAHAPLPKAPTPKPGLAAGKKTSKGNGISAAALADLGGGRAGLARLIERTL